MYSVWLKKFHSLTSHPLNGNMCFASWNKIISLPLWYYVLVYHKKGVFPFKKLLVYTPQPFWRFTMTVLRPCSSPLFNKRNRCRIHVPHFFLLFFPHRKMEFTREALQLHLSSTRDWCGARRDGSWLTAGADNCREGGGTLTLDLPLLQMFQHPWFWM